MGKIVHEQISKHQTEVFDENLSFIEVQRLTPFHLALKIYTQPHKILNGTRKLHKSKDLNLQRLKEAKCLED